MLLDPRFNLPFVSENPQTLGSDPVCHPCTCTELRCEQRTTEQFPAGCAHLAFLVSRTHRRRRKDSGFPRKERTCGLCCTCRCPPALIAAHYFIPGFSS